MGEVYFTETFDSGRLAGWVFIQFSWFVFFDLISFFEVFGYGPMKIASSTEL